MSKISDTMNKLTGNGKVRETDAAYDKIVAAKSFRDDLVTRIEKKNVGLLELEKSLSKLSNAAAEDDSQMPKALKARQAVNDLTAEIEVLRLGLKGAGEAIATAEREFNAAGFGKRVSELKRTCTLKLNSAQGIEAAVKDLAQHWRNYLSAAGKQVALTPGDIGGKGGVMTRIPEIIEAFSQELRRQNPIQATVRSDFVPLPGQDTSAFKSDKNLASFAAATEAANAHLIALFEKSNAPAPVEKTAPAPLPAPAPVISLDGNIIPDAPQGINAAAMPPRKETLAFGGPDPAKAYAED